MKKLVFSAFALTLTGSAALANDSDWVQLDKDVQALSASVQDVEGTGINISGRIRALYENSGDIPAGANDLGGFAVYNARLYMEGTTSSNVSYKLEQEFATSPDGDQGGLLDAYLDVQLGADIFLRIGQFRAFVIAESQIDSGNLFFTDRSQIARQFARRTGGAAVAGKFDAFEWGVSIMNGSDGLGDDLFYSLRGGISILGEGTQMMEGAYGASEDMEASAGLAYYNDDAIDDGDGIAFEATLASSMFSLQATVLSVGDGGFGLNSADQGEYVPYLPTGASIIAGDATPWAIGGTFMLTNQDSEYGAWELGLRFQDMDDALSTRLIDVGANYYVDGHNMKYIINWTQIDTDIADSDVSLIRVGINTRF